MTNFAQRARKVLKKLLFFLRPKIAYVGLGDSSVEGIGASHPKKSYVGQLTKLLEQDYRVELFNLGRGGSTTADVIAEQLPKLQDLKVDIITLSIGPNDIKNLSTVGEYKNNLSTILDTLSTTGAKVLINTIPDMSKSPLIPKLIKWIVKIRVVQFNAVIKSLSQEYQVTVCDLHELSARIRNPHDFLSEDRFHPSDLGYSFWARAFFLHLQLIMAK